MKLTFENFITDKTLKPFVDERISEYETKASEFLRKEFAPSVSLLDEGELLQVIRLAYKHASKRGIKTEVEHLKYLIPVMFWGSYFEMDPQYSYWLYKAGWLDKNGYAIKVKRVKPLLEQLDQWFKQTESDLKEPRRLTWAFAKLYRQSADHVDLDFILSYMELLWPARFECMNGVRQEYYAKQSREIAAELRFTGLDGVTYVCLSLYFGFRFADDPRYPWARAIFEGEQDISEKRVLLGQGALDYWDGLIGGN
ncbi:hypothetical protein [Kangiella shandongensis]|uniref:hypothetical protein n=1 Tax=Kangiella shandongensis TaxID=2763258 RepID=UPI001CBD34C2|nr:hypothetical protein [Kangiella shandongensis]